MDVIKKPSALRLELDSRDAFFALELRERSQLLACPMLDVFLFFFFFCFFFFFFKKK